MKITIIIIISFLVVGMYSFRNSILNVHDIVPDNLDLSFYNEDSVGCKKFIEFIPLNELGL